MEYRAKLWSHDHPYLCLLWFLLGPLCHHPRIVHSGEIIAADSNICAKWIPCKLEASNSQRTSPYPALYLSISSPPAPLSALYLPSSSSPQTRVIKLEQSSQDVPVHALQEQNGNCLIGSKYCLSSFMIE